MEVYNKQIFRMQNIQNYILPSYLRKNNALFKTLVKMLSTLGNS